VSAIEKKNSLVEAIEDLKNRSLVALPNTMARLVYLASTRDYMVGRYFHEGLAMRFRRDLAELAIEFCHREAFERLLADSLDDFVREVESFIRSSLESPSDVLKAWKALQPYRMLVPPDCNPASGELFFSNIRITIAVLEARLVQHPDQRAAWRPQSLVQ
jgi:hypothetical protein